MTETTNIPEPAADPDATFPTREYPGADTVPHTPHRSRSRTALIAGGAALAALIIAGGGVAVGVAMADELPDDEHDETVQTIRDDADAAPSAPYGAESARDVQAIIAAASGVAKGDVVGLDADQDGTWEVQLRRGSGDESVVRVDANGAAIIISAEPAEPGDQLPNGVLDRETVDAIVQAALSEADGTVTEIEVDDDQVTPYEVSILTSALRTVTLDLDADFKVVSTASED